MFSRELDPSQGRAGRFVPTLETLEDRCCPSTISFNNGVLLLAGLSANGQVSISDHGNGVVDVTLNNRTTTYGNSRQLVNQIVIDAPTASDNIHYALTKNSKLTHSEQLTVNVSGADDQVALDFSNGIANASLGVNVNGLAGRDETLTALFGSIQNSHLQMNARLGFGINRFLAQLNGDLTGNTTADVNVQGNPQLDSNRAVRRVDAVSVQVHGNIVSPAKLSVEAQGGPGDDTLHVDYYGKVTGNGSLSIQERGTPGWDWMASSVNLIGGSTGSVSDHIGCGPGSDLIALAIHNQGSQLHSLSAGITGVNADSVTSHTPNVSVS